MTEGQKTRHLGRGMKPRNSNADPVEEAISETAGEGQSPNFAHEENKEVSETKAEPGFSENPASDPTNLPATEEVISGQEPPVAETPSESTEISRLTELMNQSRQESAPEQVDAILEAMQPGGLIVAPTAEEIAAIAGEEAPEPMDDDIFGKPLLGEQPNKSFNMVVNIGEGYIDSIRQQAESDGITPEEWVSVRFSEYLESWWAPARSK